MKPSRDEVTKIAAKYPSHLQVWHIDLERFAAAIYSKGFAAGAEDMRGRAAELCDYFTDNDSANMADICAEKIRALPITPTNQVEGEQG